MTVGCGSEFSSSRYPIYTYFRYVDTLLSLAVLLFIGLNGAAEARCSSWAYCSSPLLDSVQRAGLFKDSKTFVDMPSIVPAEQLEKLYFQQVPQPANAAQLRQFVAKYFLPAGADVVAINPRDWRPNPSFLNSTPLSF